MLEFIGRPAACFLIKKRNPVRVYLFIGIGRIVLILQFLQGKLKYLLTVCLRAHIGSVSVSCSTIIKAYVLKLLRHDLRPTLCKQVVSLLFGFDGRDTCIRPSYLHSLTCLNELRLTLKPSLAHATDRADERTGGFEEISLNLRWYASGDRDCQLGNLVHGTLGIRRRLRLLWIVHLPASAVPPQRLSGYGAGRFGSDWFWLKVLASATGGDSG